MPRDGGSEAASDEPIDTTKTAVGFGKHKGKLWSDVPLDYLMWLAGSDGASSATAQQEIDRRASVAPDFGPEGTADHPDATTPEGDVAAAEAEAEYYGAHDTFHQD